MQAGIDFGSKPAIVILQEVNETLEMIWSNYSVYKSSKEQQHLIAVAEKALSKAVPAR